MSLLGTQEAVQDFHWLGTLFFKGMQACVKISREKPALGAAVKSEWGAAFFLPLKCLLCTERRDSALQMP